MKQRIVLWGEDENEKKALIALELNSKESKVNIYSFPEEVATEEFYKSLMDNWRNGQDTAFPEGHTSLSRPLSVTDDLLPENIKVKRTDLIARAKTEWHFAVLSAKLYEMYKQELEEYKDRLGKLTNFDDGLWNDMKTFWTKVQNQVIEKNLFRDQADELRSETNKIFDALKEKKSVLNEELKKASKEVYSNFSEKLNVIEEKIEKGLGLKPLFEELKDVQKEFKEKNVTRGDRNRIWTRLDNAFKAIKEKRFGSQANTQSSTSSRLQHRYNGLLNAIKKMEQSINRDKADQKFQTKRIETTDGQLELQIRQAKMKMIEERIKSKEEKLNEMMQTKISLEQSIEKDKKKAEAQAKKAQEKKEIAKAKKVVKEKIATRIEEDSKAREVETDKLEDAAKAIKESSKKPKKAKKDQVGAKEEQKQEPETAKKEEVLEDEGLLAAIGATVGETLTDVVDTVKAVAEVVGDKVEDKVDDIKENIVDKKNKAKTENKVEDDKTGENDGVGAKEVAAGAGLLGGLAAGLSGKLDSAIEKAKDIADKIEDKVEDIVDDVKENVTEVKTAKEAKETETNEENPKEKIIDDELPENLDDLKPEEIEKKEARGGLLGALSEKLEDVVEKVKDIGESIEEKGEELVQDVKENMSSDDTPKEDNDSGVGAKEVAAGAGLLGGLAAGLSGKIGVVVEKAKDMVEEITDGVDNEDGSIMDTISSKVKDVTDSAKEFLSEEE